MRYLRLSVATSLVLLGVSGQAADIPVVNHSFEADGQVCCNPNAVITGWNFNSAGASGTQNQSPNNPVGTDGNFWAFVNLDNAGQTASLVTTTSPTIIAPNTTYTLTVALGNNFQPPAYGDPGADSISILSGSTPISTFTVPYGTIPNDTFLDFSTTYTSGANSTVDPNVGTALNILLSSTAPNDVAQLQPLFDNVRLTAVPEPASLMLLGFGAIGLFVAGRRRK